ncbi:hypothetical protein FOA43_003590 [Brettanomyces nanus]|uniref:Uncharacterized protein n=1 Tax=Eeniella nana TaxID=13502 RepID=A0A875SBC1_EENNA|nr:uncharacterized protein FOA43_003590 [Brettanomyces nanus]QPG76204.1 hypothetical protein FOA43_003590 [Brettanomyces nanus]
MTKNGKYKGETLVDDSNSSHVVESIERKQPEISIPSILNSGTSVDSKLDVISKDVVTVLRLLHGRRQACEDDTHLPSLEDLASNSGVAESNLMLNMTDRLVSSGENSPMCVLAKVPGLLNLDKETALSNSLPNGIFRSLNMSRCISPQNSLMTNVITIGLLDEKEALKLLTIFRDRYGRWISFPDTFSTEQILRQIERKCPLLLTVACCLSLKYSDPLLKDRCYLRLLETIKLDLQRGLVDPPLCLEFLQAVLVLSIYATNLSETDAADLHIDSWDLSSFGISLFLKMNHLGLLNRLYDANEVEPEFNELTAYRTWNILVLVQLAYSLILGRRSNYSLDLLKPKEVSEFSMSTKFDYRIIAEVLIYIVNYHYSVLNGSLICFKKDIEDWFHRWNYMFGKSLNQFIEIDYHWTNAMVLLRIYRFRIDMPALTFICEDGTTGTVHSDAFSQLRYHTVKVVELMSSIKDDSYFAFLSDQIHIIVFFSCIVLQSLLSFEHHASETDHTITDPLKEIGKSAPISLLIRHINRLKKVSTSQDDTFFKYSVMLEKNLLYKFPSERLELQPMVLEELYSFEDIGDNQEEEAEQIIE